MGQERTADEFSVAAATPAAEVTTMWRGFFLALGITLCILGAECLVLEKVVLADSGSPPPATTAIGLWQAPPPAANRDYKPPDWVPWTMLTGGAIIILYSFTIPRRVSGG